MVRDFADLNNDGLATRALSRLAEEGMHACLTLTAYIPLPLAESIWNIEAEH